MGKQNRDGVVVGRNLGSEFSIGDEQHMRVTVRLGPGLYKSWDGRICQQPRWVASRWDRTMGVVAVITAFGGGWLAAEAVETSLDWLVFAAIACIACVVGWVAHRTQPDL